MKNPLQKTLILFLLSALCLTCCACGQPGSRDSREAVTLWYAEGSELAAMLETLAEEYNASLGSSELLPVSLRAFPDEDSLAAGFNTARPDLLLCSHSRAFSIYATGVIRDMGEALDGTGPAYPDYLKSYSPCIGNGYFPIGFETQLLYVHDNAANAADWNLMRLLEYTAEYGLEEGLPFMTTDSFSALLYDMLLSWGTELHGIRQLDITNLRYLSAYNLLAEAAFTGGLISSEVPAEVLVQSGYVSCAAINSASLIGADMESCTVFPLPRLQTSQVYLAQAEGLAVTARDGRDLQSIAGFLSWLSQGGRMSVAALGAGLVPAVDFENVEIHGILQTVLLELANEGEAHFPMPESDFYQNRALLEAELRAAMELLN